MQYRFDTEFVDMYAYYMMYQAKSLVESAPAIVKKDLTKDEAEKYGKQLEAVGAKIEIV